MKTTMLEYCKMILGKVCFNRRLYRKEFRKSRQWLTESEREELKRWLRENRLMPSYHLKSYQ
ncbi:MAG: hypothetical protein HC811_09260 [Flammeovirgaceae bacterium]|nr:hypothetical protein [Flammeovirgaceae bacterium]